MMSDEKRSDACEKTDQDGDVLAALDSSYVKHPLHNGWDWWFFKNDKSREWRTNLKQITVFSTVEDFWALHNHIQPVSNLPAGCDYMLFKTGIEPTWEDSANKRGGRWLMQTGKTVRAEKLDTYWLEILLLLVGEGFGDDADCVNGVVVQIRAKMDKLALWTKTTDKQQNDRIERRFREVLKLPSSITTHFEPHQDALKSISAPRKPFSK
ncbi:eukaryotic translation initiation factor 4E-1A-like [Sycon ciliatum]|uniref:eukaryotic translation initiation factor 4E-1A-like n=1 Tax=Sycon ciliatum TaxID=27933 RepID=UPI0020AA169A|eukprot:scpid55315/ scgid25976/ Eukaryotic translation initiation factor 4E; eIF-4F 25 kDa subunit; mRNA cap-binding protein &gt; Eukaryotic translation initiation factor 4E; eIF-4F 25 kDa subunit